MGTVENKRRGIVERFSKCGGCQNKLWMLKFYVGTRGDDTCTWKRLFKYPETIFSSGNSWAKIVEGWGNTCWGISSVLVPFLCFPKYAFVATVGFLFACFWFEEWCFLTAIFPVTVVLLTHPAISLPWPITRLLQSFSKGFHGFFDLCCWFDILG